MGDSWIDIAFSGLIAGWFSYSIAWFSLAGFVEKQKMKAPAWPVCWAMSVGFVVISLFWGGLLNSPPPNLGNFAEYQE